VATVSPPGGIRGERRTKTGTEREQLNGGEFPKTLTPSASIDIKHTLELEHTTLSISLSTLSLRDPSGFKLNPVTHAFLSFFFFLYNARSFEYFFSIYEFNYLHRNLTVVF
jgi:hypothetical protein